MRPQFILRNTCIKNYNIKAVTNNLKHDSLEDLPNTGKYSSLQHLGKSTKTNRRKYVLKSPVLFIHINYASYIANNWIYDRLK